MMSLKQKLRHLGLTEFQIEGVEILYQNQQNFIVNETDDKQYKLFDIEPIKPMMDKCVICGKETVYPMNLNIEYREHYVDGCGQLCIGCYNNSLPI